MAVERPGRSKPPYASRPENQEVRLTRADYADLMSRLGELERKVEELQTHTHEYRKPGPMRPVTGWTKPPTIQKKIEQAGSE